MNRRWLITVSLLAHAGLGLGLFVAGVWRIERLDPPKYQAILGVPLPMGGKPEGGSSEAKTEPEKQKKKEREKKIVKDTQPVPKPVEVAELTKPSATDGEGEGTGKGSGIGDGEGPPGGESCDDPLGCGPGTSGTSGHTDPVCGNSVKESGEACDDGNLVAGDGCSATCATEIKTINVPPTVLQGMRISGETQVHAPDVVKTMMLRDGKDKTIGALKLCIAADGAIKSVSIVKTTNYEAYDTKLVSAARSWRYKPYTVNGAPMPVCGVVTFVYTIR